MTDSPSVILSRAADLIRDTAAAATDGPWFAHDTWLDNGGFTATVLSGEPGTGGFERLRAWLPSMSQEPWDASRNVWNDARWIALMSPAVADAQERILRASSAAWAKAEESYRRDRSVINPSPGELSGHWGTWGMTLEERVGEADRAALALARAVLGEKEEQ